MDAKTRARYDARATILKAMAHPTRLFIIDQLAEGERCVCESTGMKGSPNNMRRTDMRSTYEHAQHVHFELVVCICWLI